MGKDEEPSARQWCGSTNVMFDLELDKGSAYKIAFSPEKLDQVIIQEIKRAGMERRTGLVDPWENMRSGPSSLFHSLQESHVRAETWPDRMHVQGEVQLCNFSRDNSGTTKRLAERIIKKLKPKTADLLIIVRGPGRNFDVRAMSVVRQEGKLVFPW